MTTAHSKRPGMKVFMTLPGNVVQLFAYNERLFCAYEVKRKWWQFWLPKERFRIAEVLTEGNER